MDRTVYTIAVKSNKTMRKLTPKSNEFNFGQIQKTCVAVSLITE